MPAGRPPKYNKKILKLTKNYIETCEDVPTDDGKGLKNVNIPTIEGLAIFLKLNPDTIYAWRKEKPEVSEIIRTLLAKQARALINNGLKGTYNPTIAKVLLTKHGYRDIFNTGSASVGGKVYKLDEVFTGIKKFQISEYFDLTP